MLNFTGILTEVLKKVAKRNQEREDVATADPRVFEQMEKEVVDYGKSETSTRSRADMYRGVAERMRKVQEQNEADPNVETAHSSVFDDFLEEIKGIDPTVESQTREMPTIPLPDSSPQPTSAFMSAMTNSKGGSLSIRKEPQMGAASHDIRIPDSTLLKVIDYSENKINLDGKVGRFALVEYEGVRGWILEHYLNFN